MAISLLAYLSNSLMRSQNARIAVLVYSLVTAIALTMGFVRGNPDLFHHPYPLFHLPSWMGLSIGAISGIVVGQSVVWLSQRAITTWRIGLAVRLHRGLREVLGVIEEPMPRSDIVILALSSSIGEELLFRGWLAPFAGIIISSIIFGALHYAPGYRGMWVWIPSAVFIGLIFAGLFFLTGNLLAPMIAHFLINSQNLYFINNYDSKLEKSKLIIE